MTPTTALLTRPAITHVPNGRVALWWVILSEVVIFGGLITAYLLYRLRHPEWGELAAHTSTPLGALNTLVLLTSSLFIALAHKASTVNDRARVGRYMHLTIALGLVFLVVKAVEYTSEIGAGFTLTAGLFWSFYYFLTGLHATHVVVGMLAIALVRREAVAGRHLPRVELVGLYWHFVDIVWIFLFPLLYVAK